MPIASLLPVLLAFLLAGSAAADSLPIHFGVLHFNPFVPGPPAAGLLGPAACGTPGEIVPPLSMGVTWTPGNCPTPGIDSLVSQFFWHIETEVDILGWVGPALVRCNNQPPFVVNFGPGPDYVCHVNVTDGGASFAAIGPRPIGGIGPRCVPGNQETGSVCFQDINFLAAPVAVGFSITEQPEPNTPAAPRGNCIVVSGDQTNGVETYMSRCDPTPIPAIPGRGLIALVLAWAAATVAALRWRRPRGATAVIG